MFVLLTRLFWQNYFWQQFGKQVAPLLNKSFVIWEADPKPIDIASMPPRSIVDPFQSPATADAFVEAGIPVILVSAGLSWYLDSECAGYNHQVRSLPATCYWVSLAAC